MDSKSALLKEIIWAFNPLSDRSFSLLKASLEFRQIQKGDTFIKINQRNENEYFVLDGICRSFLTNPEGDDITISFFQKKSILSPFVTRTSNELSLLNFEALADMEIAYINAKKFESLMIDYLDIREMGNAVLRMELLQKVNKEIGMASLTAKERLLNFRTDYPMLENLIPHPHIASYLGITNISLSRLRGALSKK
jgi:CRP-like cAMP-binding protein